MYSWGDEFWRREWGIDLVKRSGMGGEGEEREREVAKRERVRRKKKGRDIGVWRVLSVEYWNCF